MWLLSLAYPLVLSQAFGHVPSYLQLTSSTFLHGSVAPNSARTFTTVLLPRQSLLREERMKLKRMRKRCGLSDAIPVRILIFRVRGVQINGAQMSAEVQRRTQRHILSLTFHSAGCCRRSCGQTVVSCSTTMLSHDGASPSPLAARQAAIATALEGQVQ